MLPAMDPTRNNPVALAERRLAWLESRQRVLAGNISHADTPGFRPRELQPFAETMSQAAGPRGAGLAMARTDPRHATPPRAAGPRVRLDRDATERAPNGNAVALDQQAMKVADTDTAHAFTTGLHRRYLGLFRTALGRNQ